MIRLLLTSAAVALGFIGVAAAAGSNTLCPSSIATDQAARALPTGFTAGLNSDPQALVTIEFWEGQPNAQGMLSPDDDSDDVPAHGSFRNTFTFDASYKRPITMSCVYANTAVTLVSVLGDKVKRCTITYTRDIEISGLPQIQAARCE